MADGQHHFWTEIIEHLTDAVLVCSARNEIRRANTAAGTLLGLRASDLIGRDLAAVSGAKFAELVSSPVHDAEMFLEISPGEEIPVRVSVTSLPTSGAESEIVLVIRDIREKKRSESEIKRSFTLLQSTLNSLNEGILVLDRDRHIVLYNPRGAAMWNMPDDLLQHGNDRQIMRYAIEQLVDPEGFVQRARAMTWPGEEVMLETLELKDGRTFERYSIPHRVDGETIGRVWSFRDVTLQRAAQKAIEKSETRYRLLFERNLAGVYTCRTDGEILTCNDAFSRMLGALNAQAMEGKNLFDFHVSRKENDEIFRMLETVPTLPSVELTLVGLSGHEVRVLETLSRIEIDDEVVIQGTVLDISDLKRAEEQIRFHAYHDILTCLPNRQLFRDRVPIALAQARRAHRNAAILFIDLDDFKKVNETQGHSVGDEALIILGERLLHVLRKGDTLARPGGDEFHVLISDAKSILDVERLARKILHTIAKALTLGDHELFLTASIGIAMFPADGQDEEALMKSADSALSEAKQAGRNTYRLATAEMSRRAMERFSIESALRRGIEKEEFTLHYQPIVSASSGRITTFEALVRWRNPERGLLPPLEFIRVAEESGLIVPLGDWILRRACEDAAKWQDRGFRGVRVAVNISAKQLETRAIIDSVLADVNDAHLPADLLELEITESLAAQDPTFTISLLRELREQGIRVAIDDIGTGYSSLSYLKHFPVTTVKIDQGFVRNLLRDRSDEAIVIAVLAVAHSLDLEVIAEGVEEETQAGFLRQHHCDFLQGFLFGRPQALEAWIGRDPGAMERPAG